MISSVHTASKCMPFRFRGSGNVAMISFVLVLAFFFKDCNASSELKDYSLVSPFGTYSNRNGDFQIENWEIGGSTQIKKNFIRLTEDKQSQRGWLINTQPLNQRSFGIRIKFRISGKSQHLYGDGLGLWLTEPETTRNFRDGPIVGHPDKFVGIGIVFDTFINSETGHVHKDCSLVVNDAMVSVLLDEDRPGCSIHYRYWEGRDNFDITSFTIAHLVLQNNILTLDVDKYGQGSWTECFSVDISQYKIPSSWYSSKQISFSAGTGALSDNHDLLELKVAEPEEIKRQFSNSKKEDAKPVPVEVHEDLRASEVGTHVNNLAQEVSVIGKGLQNLQHKSEYDIEKVKLELEKIIETLRTQESKDLQRIIELEKGQESTLNSEIMQRISTLENEMNTKIAHRISQLELNFNSKLESRISALERIVRDKINDMTEQVHIVQESGNWKIPMILVVVLLAGLLAYTFRSLNKINRRDKII